MRAPHFLGFRQFVDLLTKPAGVVDHHRPSARLDDDVVPGRHNLAVLGLRRIPAGRDVALRPLENYKRVIAAKQRRPLLVGPCKVRRNVPLGPRLRSRVNGTRLATRPSAPPVTRSPSRCASISECSTSTRSSRKAGGRYIRGPERQPWPVRSWRSPAPQRGRTRPIP